MSSTILVGSPHGATSNVTALGYVSPGKLSTTTTTRAEDAKKRCTSNDQYSRVIDIVETVSGHGYSHVILPKLSNATVARLQGDGFAVRDVSATVLIPGAPITAPEGLTQIRWD